jgi:nitrite reductase (NADH) large subunit
LDQAKIAAVNMLRTENKVPYTGTLPWTTLKVAGINLTSMGDITRDSGVIERGVVIDIEKGIYRKMFFKEDKLRGLILIGTNKDILKYKKLVIQGASFDEVKSSVVI